MKNIVIFYISEFGGHSKAAKNVKEALLYRDPSLSVQNINGFGYFYPRTEKVVDFLYTGLVKHMPHLWGKVYDKKPIIKNLSPVRKFISEQTFKSLSRFIKKYSPDCFVATQAFPCGLIADFKAKYNSKIPLIAVVTDYHPHGFWIHPSVDKYVVASSDAVDVLVKNGISREKIEVLGIPVSIKFLKTYARPDIAREFGFAENLKTVLIMGGGLGIGPIEKVAQKLDSFDSNFQIIVVCGTNKKLFTWFENNKSAFKKPMFYFGYIDFVDKLMGFSDFIITKGGGITISEALTRDLAIIITNPIPGQEERNVNYLLKQEAIIRADNPETIGECVRHLLEDKGKLESLKTKAKNISTASSSLEIADLIIKTLS